jgi:LiaF transmembrane domain
VTINRRLLAWGVFFLATGAVVLAAQGGLVTAEGLADALRLWPMLVIVLGIGLLVRRTRFAAAGTVTIAVTAGLFLGGAIAAAPRVDLDCGNIRQVAMESRSGTFDGAASVDLDLALGDLEVTTEPGSDWRLRVAGVPGRDVVVDAGGDRLSVASATQRGWSGFRCGGETWRLALPAGRHLDLATEIGAGRGTLDLAGATLGDLRLVVNAGDARVDLAEATIEDLSLRVNGGAAGLDLPDSGDLAADVAVNAGAIQICAPDGLGLRVRPQSTLASITYGGLVRVGDAWESPDYATATHHADVTIAVNVGSVDVNPMGGCK